MPAVPPGRAVPQRPTLPTGVDIRVLMADAKFAQAEGFTRKDVEAQLRQFGLPDDQIQQILDAAGF